jgi:hypothetical protein
LSGGANAFKRNRGAASVVEHIAVFCHHDNVPWYQRAMWKIVQMGTEKIITTERAT